MTQPCSRRAPRARRNAAKLLLGLALAGLCACQADRRLHVTSEPPGADVRVDGFHVGRTPVDYEFIHYGTRRVTLYMEGHLSETRVIQLEAPWYARFPLDIVTEVLLPLGWRDVHELHAVLVQGTGTIPEPDLESVLQRAESLRRAQPEGPLPLPPEASEPARAGGVPRP